MKKIIYISFLALSTLTISCTSDILDTENLFEQSLETFYKTPDDIAAAMGGVYTSLYVNGVHSNEHVTANLLSDMMFAGGGPDDISAKNADAFLDPSVDTYRDLWRETYNGVTRANAVIEKVENTDFSAFFDTNAAADKFKNQVIGEAYFMRAFLYFRAAKFFGGLPLILKVSDDRTVARSSFEETFAQIASDLKKAIETLPNENQSSIPTSEYGHANRWVAEAYMGRVFLFYTGYMTNMAGSATSELPLTDGGSLSKTNVAGYLQDCISSSGYSLTPDFRNLWPYSYVNESAGSVVLPWADTEGLAWVGQDGHSPTFGTGNNETMFAFRYTTTTWGQGQKYNNRVPLFFGIRDNSMVPFGQGWGWGTVNPTLWNSWNDADPRKLGSILQVGKAEQGTGSYQADKGDHETGLVNKKYTTIQHDGAKGVQGMFSYLYNQIDADMQLWAAQDFIFMRFADVLLMHSEITETATGLNLVRQRATLPAIGYSLNAIKQERLHEFSFEGLRWFDIVRWGDVDTAFNGSINVRNSGVDATYKVTYRSETKGLLPIPETEIDLSHGAYKQNPGW